MTMNHSTMIGPKKSPTRAVPLRCMMKSAPSSTMVIGST